MEKYITLPLTLEKVKDLRAGDSVYLTGTIYTSRDAGHKRMCEMLARGEQLPIDPTDATIYYVGPTPAKPGKVIGSADNLCTENFFNVVDVHIVLRKAKLLTLVGFII